MKTYTGGCHCGVVRYEVETDLTETIECNCSHCAVKGLILTFVDQDKFRLTQGEDMLTSYQFNNKNIDHLFCEKCGVESFAHGIAFPKMAVNARCLDGVDLSSLNPQAYNGKDL